MKQGPAYSRVFLEVHSIEIKNNLATWLPGYRLLASLQISNQLDETQILCLDSAGLTVFANTVFSGEMAFQMDWQELQVQVRWSKWFPLEKKAEKKFITLKILVWQNEKFFVPEMSKKLFDFSLQDKNFHYKIDLNF